MIIGSTHKMRYLKYEPIILKFLPENIICMCTDEFKVQQATTIGWLEGFHPRVTCLDKLKLNLQNEIEEFSISMDEIST